MARPFPGNDVPLVDISTGLMTQIWFEYFQSQRPTANSPLVILSSGQSNFVVDWSYAWTPASNAKVWNWNFTTATVGTAFVALDATRMRSTHRFISELGRANPERDVYLINISIGGMSIAHWMEGANRGGVGSPDILADIYANVPAALATIGVTQIDGFLWWQGESDVSEGTNLDLYQTHLHNSLLGTYLPSKSWWRESMPVIIFGVASSSGGAPGHPEYDTFNSRLRAIVALRPELRRFANPATFPSSFWDMAEVTGTTLHMTAEGYNQVGFMAAHQWMHGS